ncbi:MAG: hypothetical protein JWL86_5441 [Rhizobium sp.]|nr:hypothetical protein [Rhizobium sp.]
MTEYTREAIDRAKHGAADWIEHNTDGFPRSWPQEAANDTRRGYVLYEPDWEAPPIAGYEALEKEGIVTRVGPRVERGEERVHFQRKS